MHETMASKIPITLKGSNLGERHRYLNCLVNETYNAGGPIEIILESSESSAVDRLFKIDLASKHKYVEYILKNLQDHDMLYVTRALNKSMWLFEEQYRFILNPEHLEAHLYPHMITTAVNKMKHWIHLNLRDSKRCLEFYRYYCTKDTDYAFKFICKCSDEVILKEFLKPETFTMITPQRLKVLCEKTSAFAKLFYEMLTKNTSHFKDYIRNEEKYYEKIKCVLKADIDIFLDITEQHFLFKFKRLSTVSTKFIITYRKDRFMKKPELYTARILNVKALAQCLTPDECEDVVIKLARAKYLNDEYFFSYKNVEPFFKRLDFTKRANFKNKVFVDKDIGDYVVEWPYVIPKKFDHVAVDEDKGVFLEKEEYDNYDNFRMNDMLCFAQARCATGFPGCMLKRKTHLDSLFDEYRFSNYNKTLFELRNKLKSESSSQNRMHMFLVLVSKSGGRPENIDTLFDLLMKYKNEPSQVRAAVIRSLVKRTSVWRVTENIWKKILIFGRGLGLDGNIAEADCPEGLHAVVIRALISNRDCETSIKEAFLKNFSTFSEYSLTKAEKNQVQEPLLKMLVESANAENDSVTSVQILEFAINTLEAYKLKFETHPELTASIKHLLIKDLTTVKSILERLFRSKLGRKELYKENFDFIQTDASYVNAIRHDTSILSVDTFLKSVISDDLKPEQFLRKINVYFNNGYDDLANRFLIAIKNSKLHKNLARPMTYLIGNNLKSYILELDTKDQEHKRFSALIRANAHVTRPIFSTDSLEWRKSGAKLIANQVLKCKTENIDESIEKLLTWNKTAKLAIILAQRTNYEAKVFTAVAKMRPSIAIKSALAYFRRQKNASDRQIWEIVKPLFTKVKVHEHLMRNIRNVNLIPSSILPEYLTEAFKVVHETDFNKSLNLLFHIKKNLPNIDEEFVANVLENFAQNKFVSDKVPSNEFDHEYDRIAKLYLSIFVQYLMLCKNEEDQNRKLQNVGQLYFDCLLMLWESKTNKKRFFRYLNIISSSMICKEAYLRDEYVSCLPVMERFVRWMHGIIPMEKYLVTYVPFHLNMLYYKTIRQSVQQIPGLLEDKQRREEGYKIVGETFGRYIGQEARVLAQSYFDSVVLLYQIGLKDFFSNMNENRIRMTPYLIKGIVDASTGIECTLALNMYEIDQYSLKEHEKTKILACFKEKNLVEMQFCYKNWPETDRNYNRMYNLYF